MLISCWSVKGGSGTTVVTAGLALVLARSAAGPIRVADLAGDLPAVLGAPEPAGPGLADWLAAGPDVPIDALDRLAVDAHGLQVLPWGSESAPLAPGEAAAAGERLALALAASTAAVVDCGSRIDAAGPQAEARRALAASASLSLLVLRPCYLALRRAAAAPLRPSGVILVGEPERALGRRDVEDVLGVPVRAVVPHDRAVARAVDAGLFGRRVPRGLERALGGSLAA